MTEQRPADPSDLSDPYHSYDPAPDGPEGDVLGSYLVDLRARLGGARFEALIRTVQATCALLADSPRPVLEVPGGSGLPPDLRREYVALLAVMITGRADHRLVRLDAADGDAGWAVVDATAAAAHAPGRLRVRDTEPNGVAGAGSRLPGRAHPLPRQHR
ncbi:MULTISPECIES: hypothetical protein [Streptomyces]|uniref:hypothetical protein n=1 Tax=Streptomyces TaxID=1883 RepID=UPI0016762AF9|nr:MULTISPECIES: hypothetical protein [Streptomyces]MBD3575899.1 hypothetical protein [Streptomyces sp. KD18]GGS82013.1 hypothetical protein GCM10010286_03250 [Streptomyces toxytricini]